MALKVEDNQNLPTKKSKKRNRRKATETIVHFILDETGSMSSVRDATISGFNEYVNELRNDRKNKYTLSLTKFDSNGINLVYANTPVKRVPELTRETYRPGAMTNLNDAIGVTITNMRNAVSMRSKKCNVLVVIMTDGHENSSVEWRDPNKIQNLIKEVEQEGWTVTFLGANMDAQKVGQTYAIKSGNTKTYSVDNMAQTMRGLGAQTTAYASSATVGAATTDFFAGTSDWVGEQDTTAQKDSSIVETTACPSITGTISDDVYDALTGRTIDLGAVNAIYNPPSKKEVFDATMERLKNRTKRSVAKKPLKEEGKDNG